MALHEAPPSEIREAPPSAAIELVVADLADDPSWWDEQSARSARTEFDDRPMWLQTEGYASPLGFLFTPADAGSADDSLLRISVRHDSDQHAIEAAATRQRVHGPVRTVQLGASDADEHELTLVVGPGGAEVFADEAAWAALAKPVLLYVGLYARFWAVEREFVALQAQARRDHHHAVGAGLRSLGAQRRLTQASLRVRDRVSDWTYFSGPAADPDRSCTSEEELKACTELAEELDIDVWGKGIDELVGDVEQTYETLSDKLFHYRLFLWGASLEVVVVGLIVELLLR
jgi:hypothetical protein